MTQIYTEAPKLPAIYIGEHKGIPTTKKSQAIIDLNIAEPELSQSELGRRLGISRQVVSLVFEKHELTVQVDLKNKVCTSCKTKKPVDEFYTTDYGKHKRSSRCKVCECLSRNLAPISEESRKKRRAYYRLPHVKAKAYVYSQRPERKAKRRMEQFDRNLNKVHVQPIPTTPPTMQSNSMVVSIHDDVRLVSTT